MTQAVKTERVRQAEQLCPGRRTERGFKTDKDPLFYLLGYFGITFLRKMWYNNRKAVIIPIVARFSLLKQAIRSHLLTLALRKGVSMKISTKGRYGLRLMVELGGNWGKGPLSIREVARRQEISEKYLEQIILQLSRAGLVKSIRGAQGGYILTAAPEEISAGQVLRAVEGSLSPVECVDDGAECQKADQCVTCELWRRMKAAVDHVVDSTSIADLMPVNSQPAK